MLHVQSNILRKKIFLIKFYFCNFFRTLSGNFLHCRRNFCRRCVNCTLGFQWKFLEQQYVVWDILAFYKIFSHFERKLFVELSAKIFRRACQNNIVGVQRNILEKIFPSRVKLDFWTVFFSLWDETFWDFWWNFSSRLSKLHSTCPGEHFEKKCFHRKDFIFLILRTFSTKIFAELSELHATFPEQQFEKVIFDEKS